MPVLTILCHGTDNSRDTSTSGGHTLVISKIAELLAGTEGTDWLLLEGAGTENLRAQGVDSESFAGIVRGAGVEANVNKAVKFVTDAFSKATPQIERTGNKIRFTDMVTLNLAGHSRGSITCYKIAYALRKYPGIKVNIFAIDPVPGNNGSINKEMHDHIQLGDNVNNSFLMLAESEHRLNFRPYVDALYSLNRPTHKFDTIPGTHGGINELGGDQSEAADIVLSRALKFLQENGSVFVEDTLTFILSEKKLLKRYSSMMMRIKAYKKYASVNPLKARTKVEAKGIAMNLLTTSLNVDKHRIANVAGDKASWGGAEPKGIVSTVKAKISDVLRKPDTEGRGAHHGLNLSDAIERMTGNEAHAKRPNRFFANQHHEQLFEVAYPGIFAVLKRVERRAENKDLRYLDSAVAALGESTDKKYLEAYYAARVNG